MPEQHLEKLGQSIAYKLNDTQDYQAVHSHVQ